MDIETAGVNKQPAPQVASNPMNNSAYLFSNSETRAVRPPDSQPLVLKKISLTAELPEETTRVNYSQTPLEQFGQKMMESMGLETVLAKNPGKKLMNPVQFNQRPEGLGLGAIPKKEIMDKLKKGEAVTEKDLKSKKYKNILYLGEAEEEEPAFQYGERVTITEGKYEELDGIITAFNEEEEKYAVVELSLNGKQVKIQTKFLRKGAFKKPDSRQPLANGIETQEKKKKRKKLRWVLPGIKVKIVNKEYKDGKHYEETCFINDILDEYNFSVIIKGGEILEDLDEKSIETVMPKIGEKVMLVTGDHKGAIGTLQDRNRKENKVKVKLEGDIFLDLTQDDCSALSY